jgi:hypothetical protein
MLEPFQVSVKYFLAKTKIRTDEVNKFIEKALTDLGEAFKKDTWITLHHATISSSDAEHDNELYLSYWLQSSLDIPTNKR